MDRAGERLVRRQKTLAAGQGPVFLQTHEDPADLIERAAADETPISGIVGDDPVEAADTFIENYADGQRINKERRCLK